MRRDATAALRFLVLPTLGLVGVGVFATGHLALAVRVYALILCATALVLALLALRRAFPAERPFRDDRRAPSPGRRPPSSLARIELEAALGVAGSFDLHYRLVPRLRAIATGLLAARRRISLAAKPEAARDALGEATWPLVRPDRAAPDDRLSRGIAPQDLSRVVDSLEAV